MLEETVHVEPCCLRLPCHSPINSLSRYTDLKQVNIPCLFGTEFKVVTKWLKFYRIYFLLI